MVAVDHGGHDLVQVAVPGGVDADHRGRNGQQGDGGGRHDAGEPHAPSGRPEELGITVSGHGHYADGGDEIHRDHVGGEGAVDVVVLAVDVGGDGTADGDLPGARGHGDEVAEREDVVEQGVNGDASPDGDRMGTFVDCGDRVER